MMDTYRQQWLLLLILLVMGMWFLGERFLKVVRFFVNGVLWFMRQLWILGGSADLNTDENDV